MSACPIIRLANKLGVDEKQLSFRRRQALIETCSPDLCDCYFKEINGGLGAR